MGGPAGRAGRGQPGGRLRLQLRAGQRRSAGMQAAERQPRGAAGRHIAGSAARAPSSASLLAQHGAVCGAALVLCPRGLPPPDVAQLRAARHLRGGAGAAGKRCLEHCGELSPEHCGRRPRLACPAHNESPRAAPTPPQALRPARLPAQPASQPPRWARRPGPHLAVGHGAVRRMHLQQHPHAPAGGQPGGEGAGGSSGFRADTCQAF